MKFCIKLTVADNGIRTISSRPEGAAIAAVINLKVKKNWVITCAELIRENVHTPLFLASDVKMSVAFEIG